MCDHLRPLDVLSACDYLAVGQDLEDALCFFVLLIVWDLQQLYTVGTCALLYTTATVLYSALM